MERTKAGFKALRERVGLSQQDVANELDVNVKTVKRWEQPQFPYDAPEDAWELLEHALDVQKQQVEYAVSVLKEQAESFGKMPNQVTLTYFRDQAMFDKYGRESDPYGQANANARAAAAELERIGANVVFAYPGDGAIRTPGSNY